MNANTEIQKQKTKSDKFTWVGVFALLILAIWGNAYFSSSQHEIMPVLRISGVALLIIIAFVLAALTQKGKAALTFIKEARAEMRKVVWPTRKETLQTTLIVAVITAVMSLVLWGLDSIMLKLVYFVTTLGH